MTCPWRRNPIADQESCPRVTQPRLFGIISIKPNPRCQLQRRQWGVQSSWGSLEQVQLEGREDNQDNTVVSRTCRRLLKKELENYRTQVWVVRPKRAMEWRLADDRFPSGCAYFCRLIRPIKPGIPWHGQADMPAAAMHVPVRTVPDRAFRNFVGLCRCHREPN